MTLEQAGAVRREARWKAHLRRVYASHEPSAVERLAALANPTGSAAGNISLWAERGMRTNETLAVLDHAIDAWRR